MDKNKKLQSLSKRKDFELIKNKAQSFSYKWLKLFYLNSDEKLLKVAWSLSRKISSSVTRNRLKRWGRDNLRKNPQKGFYLFIFLFREKAFYDSLKRKDFDYVFNKLVDQATNLN